MEEQKASFPFNLIEAMMPRFPMIAVAGWMIVLVAFLIGATALSNAQATFYSDAKVVREGAGVGSAFVQANPDAHIIETWLPQFKFLGLGLGLMAITMALGSIARRLRRMGQAIGSHLPDELRPPMPPVPRRVRAFQLSTLMGIMILGAALVIGIGLATGAVPSYYNHSIAGELDPAQPGSELLAQLGLVSSFADWLNPLRMLGMAFLFTAITLALTVIISTLRTQAAMLAELEARVGSRG